jgi:hypothetical protein
MLRRASAAHAEHPGDNSAVGTVSGNQRTNLSGTANQYGEPDQDVKCLPCPAMIYLWFRTPDFQNSTEIHNPSKQGTTILISEFSSKIEDKTTKKPPKDSVKYD